MLPYKKRYLPETGSTRLALCQINVARGLGHRDQGGQKKPWNARFKKPFVPGNEEEAMKVIEKFRELGGLPPLEYLIRILDISDGGAP